jgi:3-deoxy-D-manno-octulosonate 8-phosphate phosphatase (KDO 8-P phosphatase)
MSDDIFASNGGKFITPPAQLREKLSNIKAILLDWDGVFNKGEKSDFPSSFSEVDSMGINMLRFGYYLIVGRIPFTAIVTGETNLAAFKWAGREKFDNVFFQVKNKVELLPLLRAEKGIEPDQILFVFDDILDLSLAKEVGVRFLVHRKSNPLFNAYCIKNGLCDYLTYSSGHENALREITEVALDGIDQFENTIEERMSYEGIYTAFLKEKKSKSTHYLRSGNGVFEDQEFRF